MSPNNMIPYAHFHKKWQARVKMWFDQAMKKKRRHLLRLKMFSESAPKPIDLLRPVVHCPSSRYNSRVRVGHGFTLQELKAAKINKHFAHTVGIAVDHRRRNRSLELLQLNKERLLKYKANLIIDIKKSQHNELVRENLNKFHQPVTKCLSKVPTDEEKKFSAFVTLRKARAHERFVGKKLRKKKFFQSDDALGRASGKKKCPEDDE